MRMNVKVDLGIANLQLATLGLLQQIDAELWNDAYGFTVFQFPGVTVHDSDMTGVNPGPLSPTIFWNYWEWGIPAAE